MTMAYGSLRVQKGHSKYYKVEFKFNKFKFPFLREMQALLGLCNNFKSLSSDVMFVG